MVLIAYLVRITYLLSFIRLSSINIFRVKIHELMSLNETTAVITIAGEEIERIGWSEDGQLLCVATASGSVAVYVSRLPRLAVSHGDITAVLTSLSHVTVSLIQVIEYRCAHVLYRQEINNSNMYEAMCQVDL